LSGFTNTQLKHLLQQRQIKNVAIAGFLTNVCVEATARSAYDLGYRVVVIRDPDGGYQPGQPGVRRTRDIPLAWRNHDGR